MILSFFTGKLERALGIRPAVMRVIETIGNAVLIVLVNIATGVITARLLGPEGWGPTRLYLIGFADCQSVGYRWATNIFDLLH